MACPFGVGELEKIRHEDNFCKVKLEWINGSAGFNYVWCSYFDIVTLSVKEKKRRLRWFILFLSDIFILYFCFFIFVIVKRDTSIKKRIGARKEEIKVIFVFLCDTREKTTSVGVDNTVISPQ